MNHIHEVLGVTSIIAIFATGLILFVRSITGYYLRKRMVDKGYVDKDSIAILSNREKDDNRLATLKWGLVVFFAGLGLVVIEFIDYDADSPLPYGVFILSVSLGLLIHFFISGNLINKKEE